MRTSVTRPVAPRQLPALIYYGAVTIAALLISLVALEVSHKLALTDPVVVFYALLLALPALVTARAPALGLALVLVAALLSWAVPALIPQLYSLGPETTFGVTVLTAWAGLLMYTYKRRERLIWTPILLPLLAWNAWVLLSFVVNIHSAASNHSTLFTVFLLIDTAFFVLVANAVRTERAMRWLLLALVFSSIPLSLVAYLQYSQRYIGINYTAVHPGLEKLAENLSYTVRVAGTLADATLFSVYYLVVFVLATAFLVIEQQRRLRLALALTIAFDIWPFLMTFTKSTLIVIVLTLLVFAWLRRSWRVAIISMVVSAVSWLALATIPLTSYFTQQAASAAQGQGEDLSQRVQFIRACAAAAPSHALFGLGPLGATSITGSHCHSLPPELLVDFGVIGTLLFCWFAWRVARLSWRASQAPPQTFQGVLAQANLALLIGMALMSLLWPLVNFPLAWYWVVVVLVVGGGIYQLDAIQPQRRSGPLASEGMPTRQPEVVHSAWLDDQETDRLTGRSSER